MEGMPMTPKDYVDILKLRKWSLILPAVIIILAGICVALGLPSVYKSTSTILIEEQDVPDDFVMTTVTSYAEQRLGVINARIMSHSSLVDIVERLNLYPEYKGRWTMERIVAKMREDTVLEPVSTRVVDHRTGRPTTATIAFTLSYEGSNPNRVLQGANVLASLFLSENLREREQQSQETLVFLEAESKKINDKLVELDARIARFKEEHINELPENLPLNLRGLDRTERDIGVALQELRTLKEKQEYFQTQLAGVDPYVKETEEISSRRRLEALKVELVFMTNRFSEEYPDVIKTRAEIAELEKQLAEEEKTRKKSERPPDNPPYINLAARLASIQSEIISTQRKIESLNRTADEYKRRIAATSVVEGSYNVLIAEQSNTLAKNNDLTQKIMEAQVALGLEKDQKGERFTLVDPARFPEKPYKPQRFAIMLIGVVLGIGAGIGFAAVREFSDDAVRQANQLERATNFPVLASIPSILTVKDIRRKRLKAIALVGGTLCVFVAGLAIFHFMVMDLNIFWVKLMRRLAI